MRELIVSELVTLDGRMEAPGGEPTHAHTGWVVPLASEGLFDYKFREVVEAGSLLLGRVTFESFLEGWSEREGPFADRMNTMPKHVVSSTLTDPGWNATVVTGDVPAAVRELKAGGGDPILVNGSATLMHALLREGLVDEVRLQVFPVTIGGGTPVWPESPDKVTYGLADLVRFDHGVTLQVYRPAG